MRLLDISPFKNAINSFSNMLKLAKIIEEQNEEDRLFYSYEGARAGVIQHFEFCYESSHKFIARWLEVCNGDNVDGLNKKQLFRLAQEKELIYDFEMWLSFMAARNKTSHTYDESTAEEIYEISKKAFAYFKDLLLSLEEKI